MGAWKALTSQYAGKDKWEAEIKHQEQLLHTRTWKGWSNVSLENLISQNRNAFVSMQASAEHVHYQLPNEHSRVGFLLDAIQCSDTGLQAAMASIKLIMTLKALGTILKPQHPTYCPMILLPRRDKVDKREPQPKSHQ